MAERVRVRACDVFAGGVRVTVYLVFLVSDVRGLWFFLVL